MGAIPLPEGNMVATTIRKLRAIDAEIFGSAYISEGTLGDLTIAGTLTMGDDAIWRTRASGERWEWDINAWGGTKMGIYSDLAEEKLEGWLESTNIDLGGWVWSTVQLASPQMGDATDYAYGALTLTSNSGTFDLAAVQLRAQAYGDYGGTAVLDAQAVDGNAGSEVVAVTTGTGDASVGLRAQATGTGAADVTITADDLEVWLTSFANLTLDSLGSLEIHGTGSQFKMFSRDNDDQPSLWYNDTGHRLVAYPNNANRLAIVDAKIAIEQESWVAPSLAGTWVNYSAGHQTMRYRMSKEGIVSIQGLVKSGSVGTTVFTLPAAYRPGLELIFASVSSTGFGELRVMTTGVVKMTTGSSASWQSMNCMFQL